MHQSPVSHLAGAALVLVQAALGLALVLSLKAVPLKLPQAAAALVGLATQVCTCVAVSVHDPVVTSLSYCCIFLTMLA